MMNLNSTHAAWLNLAGAVIAAAGGALAQTPPGASYTLAAGLVVNAVLHILLPDAPK